VMPWFCNKGPCESRNRASTKRVRAACVACVAMWMRLVPMSWRGTGRGAGCSKPSGKRRFLLYVNERRRRSHYHGPGRRRVKMKSILRSLWGGVKPVLLDWIGPNYESYRIRAW
jgi:hypothetical protein